MAQRILSDHFLHGALRSRPAAAAPLDASLYAELLRSAKGLGQPLGGCERIQGTPLPFAYVEHLRCFLLLVLCGVPIVYACQWQWATIPIAMLIAFAMLGLEAASVECERPFSPRPTKNNHDVEKFATLLSREVTEMLERDVAFTVSAAQASHI